MGPGADPAARFGRGKKVFRFRFRLMSFGLDKVYLGAHIWNWVLESGIGNWMLYSHCANQ